MNVIASPSQNVDDEAEDANAVDVRLTTGLDPTLMVIPGEIDEQPPPAAVFVLKDSTVTTCPSINVSVAKILLSERVPTGLPSILKINDNPSVAVKVTVSLSHIATVLGAAVAPTCNPDIGGSSTVI